MLYDLDMDWNDFVSTQHIKYVGEFSKLNIKNVISIHLK